MKSITIGSDPEFMLKDPNGNLVSAIGRVPGSKEERFAVENGHFVYYDNVLAECNIKEASSAEGFVENVRDCLTQYAGVVKPNQLVIQASGKYPVNECKHKDANVFGCDPELDAYKLAVNDPPVCAKGNTFRTAGGHLHIGYEGGAAIEGDDDANYKVQINRLFLVRFCDLVIGIPSLFMDKDPSSKERRRLYGGAGTNRECLAYGVEYRSLGNFWLRSPSSVTLMYNLAQYCVDQVVEQNVGTHLYDDFDGSYQQADTPFNVFDWREVPNIINDWDLKAGQKVLDQLFNILPKNLCDGIKEEASKEYWPELLKCWK